ncbi:MAG: FAD-dependent oxidoreductase [Halobacteria archaeon]|nr:FAD-dependent oxidoreductase [Halobacteria archaeon]
MEGNEVEVREVRNVGKDTVSIDIETPEGFDAEPGQFVQVGLELDGEFVVRHYTISSPYVNETFEVTVGIDPEGELSPVLAELEPGDTVLVDGPFGRVYYEGQDRVVVLGGGPGVGPAIGIGERALDEGNTAGVVYEDDEPVHRDRLENLEEDGVFLAIVEDGEGIDTAVGDAVDEVGGQVFVNGFSEFVDRALEALEDVGVEEDAIKVERFD